MTPLEKHGIRASARANKEPMTFERALQLVREHRALIEQKANERIQAHMDVLLGKPPMTGANSYYLGVYGRSYEQLEREGYRYR
jgi:hypothetical protein